MEQEKTQDLIFSLCRGIYCTLSRDKRTNRHGQQAKIRAAGGSKTSHPVATTAETTSSPPLIPSDPFTIFEPQNPWIKLCELRGADISPDFEAVKL